MGDSSIQFGYLASLVRRLGTPWSIFDLETSAFKGSPNFGIVDVAVFTITPDERGLLFGNLINPENLIEAQAQATHGISQKMVANQEVWGHRYAAFFHRISQEHTVSGFNIKTFDIPAVLQQNARYGFETKEFKSVADARSLYRKLSGRKGQSGKLWEFAAEMGVVPKGPLHRAEADVLLTVELLNATVRHFGEDAVINAMNDDGKKKSSSSKVSVEAVAEYVRQNGFTSFDALAEGLGLKVSDLEYPLCQAVDRGLVTAPQFAHKATRQWLSTVLQAVADAIGFEGKLKPLYEKLASIAPPDVELSYLQLRIGLLDAGYVWGMLKPEGQPA